MSDIWKQCEGAFVDNQYPLLRFLGCTNHSAVFLTELSDPAPRKAALKFISADIPAPDRQLAIWQRIEQLSHPHLLQLFRHGRCQLAGMGLLYVIMEHADENLAQFLPHRALNAQETRDLLDPLVAALTHLHGQSLSHTHVKPSNLLAVADQLKLSVDTILPLGDSREAYRDHDVYDAPENCASTIHAATAADVWSLGITVVEALMQQAPPLPFDNSADPTLPGTLPQPFLEIARHALVRDPSRRWTVAGIAAHLNPAPLAAAATASASYVSSPVSQAASAPEPTPVPVLLPAPPPSVSPVSVPLDTEPAAPLKKPPLPQLPVDRRVAPPPPEKTVVLPSYTIPVLLGVLLLLGAFFTLPKIFRSLPAQSVSTASNSVPATPKPASVATPKPAANSSSPSSPVKAASESTPAPAVSRPLEPAAPPASRLASSTPAHVALKSSADAPDRGEVLDQVLPEAPPKALATIHGKFHVLIRVQVDPVGNVTSADFDSPGPSKYFADLSLRAAQHWQFVSPVSNGRSQPSQWLIRFEFSQNGVTAVPQQQQP